MRKYLILFLFFVGIIFLFSKLVSKKPLTFLLIRENGDVFYKQLPGDYQKVTTDEMSLPNKSHVKTLEGQAHLILPDNSLVSLDKNTELQVEIQDNSTYITQLLGNTWHRIEHITKGKAYQVETPNTVAAVRGTTFAVEISRGALAETKVLAIENTIEVKNYKEENKKRIYISKQLLTQGKIARIPLRKQSGLDGKFASPPPPGSAILFTSHLFFRFFLSFSY